MWFCVYFKKRRTAARMIICFDFACVHFFFLREMQGCKVVAYFAPSVGLPAVLGIGYIILQYYFRLKHVKIVKCKASKLSLLICCGLGLEN
jgi:hypothetical protein